MLGYQVLQELWKEVFVSFYVLFPFFCHFFCFYFLEMKKKARVGGFKLGSVGEPETQLFFLCLKQTNDSSFVWRDDPNRSIIATEQLENTLITLKTNAEMATGSESTCVDKRGDRWISGVSGFDLARSSETIKNNFARGAIIPLNDDSVNNVWSRSQFGCCVNSREGGGGGSKVGRWRFVWGTKQTKATRQRKSGDTYGVRATPTAVWWCPRRYRSSPNISSLGHPCRKCNRWSRTPTGQPWRNDSPWTPRNFPPNKVRRRPKRSNRRPLPRRSTRWAPWRAPFLSVSAAPFSVQVCSETASLVRHFLVPRSTWKMDEVTIFGSTRQPSGALGGRVDFSTCMGVGRGRWHLRWK